jgi:hypothetical protein
VLVWLGFSFARVVGISLIRCKIIWRIAKRARQVVLRLGFATTRAREFSWSFGQLMRHLNAFVDGGKHC